MDSARALLDGSVPAISYPRSVSHVKHDYDLRGEAVQLQSCEDGRSLVSAGRLHSPLPLVQVSFAIFQEGKVAAFISLGNKGVV
jgi:hypothetical protein